MDEPISAVILTQNEERAIKSCLMSLSWCNEAIVIDDHSTDKTVAIARGLKAKVYKRQLSGNFAAQRNFGLAKAKNNWVLFIDADELVTKPLAKEIQKAVNIGDFTGFYIPRKDIWMGKVLEFGESRVNILRLAQKERLWTRSVHEVWDVRGKVGKLKGFILHRPHPTLEEFASHINKYSSIHAEENLREGKKSSVYKIIFFPLIKFINAFVFKQGFRDGVPGLIYAAVMSVHSFLAWSQLWLIQNKFR